MAQPYQFQDYEGSDMAQLFDKMNNLGPATTEEAGLMLATDKTKLNGISSGAEANVLESVKVNGVALSVLAKAVNIILDNAPAIGSGNFISSGGVYAALLSYYTKAEVNAIVAGLKQFTYEVVSELPTASAETMYCIYFVPSSNPKTRNIKDEYITVRSGSEGAYTYSWEQIGTTAVDISGKADKDTAAVEGNIAKFDSNGNPVDGGIPANNVAQKDGYYEQMAVGLAKNIEGISPVTDSFMERTTGGDAEVANGLAQITEVRGKSQVWNQLVQNGNFADGTTGWYSRQAGGLIVTDGIASYYKKADNYNNCISRVVPIVSGHKYLVSVKYKSDISFPLQFASSNEGASPLQTIFSFPVSSSYNTVSSIVVANNNFTHIVMLGNYASLAIDDKIADFDFFQIIDLTLLGIDNLTTVEEVEAWLAENIGLKAYYPYNPGTVLNNKMEGLESTNRNLLDTTTGKARIIGAYSDVYGNYYGITGTHGTITFTSDLGEVSTITPDSDGKFLLETPGWLDVATPGEDCAVFLWWDGTKTDYVEHKVSKAYVDVTHIWGKKNGTGDLVQVWPTGQPGLENLEDVLRNEGGVTVARKRMGMVDMGTLTWSELDAENGRFYSDILTAKGSDSSRQCAISAIYRYVYTNYSANSDMTMQIRTNHRLYLRNSAYTTSAAFKTAMSGVPLYFELATEEVFTDLVYQGSSHFADGTPVTLPVSLEADNWGIERAIPQNDTNVVTAIPEVSCKYSIDIVETAKTQQDEIENLDDKKADKNGVYDGMSVGSAKTLVGDTSSPAEYVFRKVPDGAATGNAFLMSVKGKSLVWNQLLKNDLSDSNNYILKGSTTASYSNGKLSVVFSESGSNNAFGIKSGQFLAGHKYYIRFDGTGAPDAFKLGSQSSVGADGSTLANITTRVTNALPTSSLAAGTLWIWPSATAGTMEISAIDIIDLTLMFGSGNEPSTVEEFEALYPLPYYAYNAGGIINNKTEQIVSVGFNQWDEEWVNGYWRNGVFTPNAGYIGCKNMIKVMPSTQYFLKSPCPLYVGEYDGDGNVTKALTSIPKNSVFTTAQGTQYITIDNSTNNYGSTTYNNDICINLSDASRNGTYEPYDKRILDLNIPTLTGKVNGEGESVVIASDGLKSAGSVYDEGIVENGYLTKIVKRIGVVDLGTLDWGYNAASGHNYMKSSDNSAADAIPSGSGGSTHYNLICAKYIEDTWNNIYNNANDKRIGIYHNDKAFVVYDSAYTDADAFKAAMDGVMLNYELAEPVTYILDTPVLVRYHVEAGGTERRLPEDTASVVNAPFRADAKYSVNIAGQFNAMPKNYLSVDSLDELLSTLGGALNGTITKTWNAEQQKYTFVFTPIDS